MASDLLMVVEYLVFRAWWRSSRSLWDVVHMPKSSTMRVNVVDLVMCLYRPFVDDSKIAVLKEVGFELFVGEDSCLGEAIHAPSDLHHDDSIMCNIEEIVLLDNFFWYF